MARPAPIMHARIRLTPPTPKAARDPATHTDGSNPSVRVAKAMTITAAIAANMLSRDADVEGWQRSSPANANRRGLPRPTKVTSRAVAAMTPGINPKWSLPDIGAGIMTDDTSTAQAMGATTAHIERRSVACDAFSLELFELSN